MKKIMLDPGHGGTDTGACGNGLVEKVLNLEVARKVRDILMSNYSGAEVKMSRESDVTLDANKRVKVVNDYGPDLCVSIHHNAADGKARGAEVIHANYDLYDDRLALDILDRLAKAGMPTRRAFTKLNDRGSDWYFMIREIWKAGKVTAIITEGGFMDNAADAKMLKDATFLDAEAKAIADSIAGFLQLSPKLVTEEQKLSAAISKLQQKNKLNSPEFWLENAKSGKQIKGELAAALIIKFADSI